MSFNDGPYTLYISETVHVARIFPLLTDGRNDGSISSESDSSRLRNSLSSTMGVMVEVSSKTELMEISLALLREVESRGALDRERSAELGERREREREREREGEREWLLIYTTIT